MNVSSIVWCSIHLKIMLQCVSKPKFWKYIITCASVASVFQPWFHSETFWSFWLFMFLILRVTNIIYQNLMQLSFHCQKTSSSVNTIFIIDEKHTQWNLDTKAKVFHEGISCFLKCPWNCISWNALKENFTVYPSLKVNIKKQINYLENWLAFISSRKTISYGMITKS